MSMLERQQAAVLEALADGRLAGLGVADQALSRLLETETPAAIAELLAPWRSGRPIDWVTQTVTQGELLDAFAGHCADELEDVEVLERETELLVARWRRETSRIELRAGLLGIERLATNVPTMLLVDLEGHEDGLVEAFVEDADLRSRLAVCDLGRLERIGAVRSSVFVYLEWFLRDTYGVKLLPSSRFTQGLIEKGVISLGMG